MIQWPHISLLSAWPWGGLSATVSGSVAEDQLFWPCDDLNLPPPAACDWLSVRKVIFSWSWDSPIGEFSGMEEIESGVRLYRSDILSDGELHEIGDAIETFDAMVETRGSVFREEFPDGPESFFPLWSGYFDELRIDDGDGWSLRAQLSLGLPRPALRSGSPGWILPPQMQFLLRAEFDENQEGDLTFLGESNGLTILGKNDELLGAHATGFDAKLEVIEKW
jgi:hypothetical protein